MKNLRTVLTCVCIALYCISASAQAPVNETNRKKPLLFASLPDRIPVNLEYLNSLFGAEAGRNVIVPVSINEAVPGFEGKVMSSGSDVNNRIHSVVIGSTNFQGARFTVSRIVTEQGKITYSGRILSMQHGDAFVLKNENGSWVLVKKPLHQLVAE